MSKEAVRLRLNTALRLVEESIRHLRAAPAAVHLTHFVGSAPCLLFGVYFFTDLSRGAFANDRLVGESLTFAFLYGWMKCWQAVSAAYLRASLLRKAPPHWDAAGLIRLAASQVLLQPFGLLLRAFASLFLVPYVWAATFFQNITILGDGSYTRIGDLWSDAWTEAKRWPKQAHGLAAYLSVLGIFLFINFSVLAISVPMLLKSFLGVDTAFSHYSGGMINPTFLVAMLALTYLVLDPVRKAAVAVRCFHGRSLITGEDLGVELKQIRRSSPAGAALAASLLLFAGGFTASAPAADLPPPPPPTRVDSRDLNHSIDDVLNRREFTWRSGREKEPEKSVAQMNWFEKWKHDFNQWMERTLWKFGRAVGSILHKLGEWLFGKDGDKSTKDHDFLSWLNSVRAIFWIVAILAAAVLAVLIARRWRLPKLEPIVAEPIAPTPDLREESITADQLPEDGWIQLARDLFNRGELRLALRAFYLASLAHLGTRDYIRLARHKSNRDYDRELRRRARAEAELLAAFGQNLLSFERSWYGDHPVTPEILGEFSANLERIRAC